MLNSNEKPKTKGTLMIGGVLPLVPVVIVLIWILMWAVYYFHGLSRNVSLPIVVGTILWFIIWLVRAARRG